ncbi:DNA repair protein RecO [Candidatus Pelagibacter sp.]|nr:DNA repair protein RecO [Candidatus Pelagibacter sp.]
MNWQDSGFLLSKNKYNENSIISEFYTENHGKITGIIFGGTSKKIKNYLFEGNRLHLNYNSKLQNKIGSIKIEIDEFKTPYFLEEKDKLLCIIYTMNLIKILTAENEKNKEIYLLINKYFEILRHSNWLSKFVYWELDFYKQIGYDINFRDYVDELIEGNKLSYVLKNSKKVLPKFLIDRDEKEISFQETYDALNIVGDYLDKTIIRPNNLNFPKTRFNFQNSLKST